MNYIQTLTVPANTSQSSPVRLDIRPIAGKLIAIELEFPAGTLNTTGIRILERGKQVFPYPSGWKFGNDETVKARLNWRCEGPPYEILVEGYSIAIDWPHTVTIDLEVQ